MIIGFAKGSIIFQNTLKFVHPSSFADSTRAFGITSKNPFAIWNPRPAPALYARTRPTSDSSGWSGLPDNPICNPGKAALQAVLNPDDSKDLYFVADGKGGHVFATTYAEHEKNVAAYRRLISKQRTH